MTNHTQTVFTTANVYDNRNFGNDLYWNEWVKTTKNHRAYLHYHLRHAVKKTVDHFVLLHAQINRIG